MVKKDKNRKSLLNGIFHTLRVARSKTCSPQAGDRRGIVVRLALSLSIVAVCSCSNFETSGNGDFDGYWQLETIDTLASGSTTDMHDSLVFWAVQHHLIELCSRQVEPQTFSYRHFSVFCHFSRSGDTLHFIADSLSQPKDMPVIDLRSSMDPYATIEQVQVYGLSRFDETFRILQLDSDNMTLESALLRLHFRKY